MELSDEIAEMLRDQWGLASRRQLLEAGMTESALRWRLQRGWMPVLPGVVHVDGSPLRLAQRCLAALLLVGSSGVVGGATAARRYGVTSADDHGLIRVVVPEQQRRRRVRWVDVRRSSVPDPTVRRRDGIRLSSPARAVIDAARAADAGTARAIVIEAAQRGIATVDELSAENDLLGRAGSRVVRSALAEAEGGAWSLPEADLAALAATSRVLPPMWLNPKLSRPDGSRLLTPDGWFDDVGMAVMVHSRLHHSTGEQWERTVEGDAALRAEGIVVLGVTPASLRRDPAGVLSLIERTYRAAKRLSRRPDVVAVPRGLLT